MDRPEWCEAHTLVLESIEGLNPMPNRASPVRVLQHKSAVVCAATSSPRMPEKAQAHRGSSTKTRRRSSISSGWAPG